MYHELPCIKYEDGNYAPVLHPVVDEVPVSVIVNGRTAATMMTSPTMLKELAVGFLLTEGLIKSLDEIEALAERESSVEVITKNPQKLLFSKKSVLSGCGGRPRSSTPAASRRSRRTSRSRRRRSSRRSKTF